MSNGENNQAKPVAAALPASNDLINQIVNLPCETHAGWGSIAVNRYKSGHRDALNAAALLVGQFLAATPALPAEKVQGLTDEQIDALLVEHGKGDDGFRAFARAILAASGGVPAPALPVVPHQPITAPDAKGYRPPFCDGGGPLSNCCEEGCAANRELAEMARDAAPELPEGNQQPQRDSGLAIRPSAEPAGQHSIIFAGRQPPEREDAVKAALDLSPWLAAALDDPAVCAEYKSAINAWFNCAMPSAPISTPANTEAGVDYIMAAVQSYANDHQASTFDRIRHMVSESPSHAASTEPVSNFTATQAAQLTEQDAARLDLLDGENFVSMHCYVSVYADGGAPLETPRKFYQIELESQIATVEGDTARAAIDAAILANQSQKG